MRSLWRLLGLTLVPVQLAAVSPLQAADWGPADRLTLVTHAGPGSGVDMYLRQVTAAWEKNRIVTSRISVENMAGGGGDRARRHVAVQSRGNPNVLFGFSPQLIVAPLNAKSDVTVKSFTPIVINVVEPMVLYVHAALPWKRLDDLIASARQKPRAVLQGGGGFGAPPSIAGRDLAREKGVEFSYTPFRSSGEAVIALLGGHVHFVMEQPSEADQHVKAGRIRPLASLHPSDQYPGLPTFASLGYKFRVLKQFRGLVAPPGIPQEAINFYVAAMERTRHTPEWKSYVRQNGLVEEWIVGNELAAFIDSEEKLYAKVLAEIAAKPQ
jgi:putative tricarboxylic transport membrane protein